MLIQFYKRVYKFIPRRCVVKYSSSHTTTDFGFTNVPKDEKEKLVKEIFSKVAAKYDIMNDFMSIGTHRLWKDSLIQMLGIPTVSLVQQNQMPRHLDVAGGTGDIAFRVLKEYLKYYKSYIQQTYDISNTTDNRNSDNAKNICLIVIW